MQVICKLLQKRGLKPRDCEDAISTHVVRGRFAVADGATEAFDSRRWARALVKAWSLVRSLDLTADKTTESLTRLAESLDKKWRRPGLPWYVQERVSEGAYAAFIGLEMHRDGGDGAHSWSAVSIGDCCLFLEENGRFTTGFPFDHADALSYHPHLLPSKLPEDIALLTNHVAFRRGVAKPGDSLILCSDAIAAWYLRFASQDQSYRAELARALRGTDEVFATFVERERSAGNLKNDDVAFVYIELDG